MNTSDPHGLNTAVWRKSSYSGGEGNCVEVADLTSAGQVGIRDSKDKTGPALLVPAIAWTAFIAEVRSGGWAHRQLD